MRKTGLILDARFQDHDTGEGHPERAARLKRIDDVFRADGLLDECVCVPFSPAKPRVIESNHDRAYVDRVKAACASGAPFIDVADSRICPASYDIALLAAGAGVAAVDAVMEKTIDNAFCAVRPPGHHAEKSSSMGFCLFNNVAIAARHLLDSRGLSRVLILDWDVHHGNGTQHSFESDPRVLFISLHGHPEIVYPGTGFATEQGTGRGEGFTLNIPIVPPGDDGTYRRAFDETVLPKIDDYAPEFILLSAGFDAHRADPLAPLSLETESFGWMTDAITDVARRHGDGRIVSFLEGGYDLEALGKSASLHVHRLLGT